MRQKKVEYLFKCGSRFWAAERPLEEALDISPFTSRGRGFP